MAHATVKILRATATGQLGAVNQRFNISAVQVLGGTAATTLHDDITNGATTLKLSVTAPGIIVLDHSNLNDPIPNYIESGGFDVVKDDVFLEV